MKFVDNSFLREILANSEVQSVLQRLQAAKQYRVLEVVNIYENNRAFELGVMEDAVICEKKSTNMIENFLIWNGGNVTRILVE